MMVQPFSRILLRLLVLAPLCGRTFHHHPVLLPVDPWDNGLQLQRAVLVQVNGLQIWTMFMMFAINHLCVYTHFMDPLTMIVPLCCCALTYPRHT